jgi:hypothetical protein
VRNYIGVDWADEEDAVWVVNDPGDKVVSRGVAHGTPAPTPDGGLNFST